MNSGRAFCRRKRPVAVRFFSVKPPSTLPRLKRLAVPMSRYKITHPNTTFRSTNYSKQNLDVLNRMYSNSSSVPSSPHTFPAPLRYQSPLYHNGSISTSSSPGVQFKNCMSHTPTSQMSLLQQTLRANKAQSSSKSSLVQLATQRTSVKLAVPLISPVMVIDTPPRLSRGSTNTVGSVEEQSRNPCDKDTVLSALRSKRKRWDSSASVDSSVSVVTDTDQPSAKRSKNSVQSRSPPSTGRKQPFEPLAQTSVSKRSKPIPKKSNKICLSEIEYESDSSEHAQDDISMTNDIVASASDSDSTVASVDKREKTSPILPIDEEEMSRERENYLSLLRTMFPPIEVDESLRREVPVFGATGIKSHMPTPLFSGSTATREDLLKDREAAAERVKQFLTANDETPTATASTDQKPNTISLTTSLDGAKTTDQTDGGKNPVSTTKSDATTTISSVQTGLKFPSAHMYFANPITTTTSTSGGGTTSLTGLKLASSVPSTAGPPPSTAAATLGLPTGLSLLTATAPQSSVATTQPPAQTQTVSLNHDAALLSSILTGRARLSFVGEPTTILSSALLAGILRRIPISTPTTQLQQAPSSLQVPPAVTTNPSVQQPLGNGAINNPLSLTQFNPTFPNQQPSTGLGTNTQQSFRYTSTAVSNLSFTASQLAQSSISGSTSQSIINTFNFTANGGSQQPLILNFNQQANTQSNSAMAAGRIISNNQVNSFGGQNAASFTAQPQTTSSVPSTADLPPSTTAATLGPPGPNSLLLPMATAPQSSVTTTQSTVSIDSRLRRTPIQYPNHPTTASPLLPTSATSCYHKP